jgi:hypothetical protein
MGQRISEVRVTNTGNHACSLAGYPHVTFGDEGSDHLAVGTRPHLLPETYDAPSDGRPIILASGDHAQFYLLTDAHENPKYPGCEGSGTGDTSWTIGLQPGQPPVTIGRFAQAACAGTAVTISPYTTYSAPGFDRALPPPYRRGHRQRR